MDVKHFDQLAEYWWQVDGPLWTLHAINPLRLEFMQKHCHLSQQPILDIGCGGGIVAETLAKQEAQVMGIDLSTESIKVARQHAQESALEIDYQCRSVESLSIDFAAHFEVITCLELLEHVDNPAMIIEQAAGLLKTDGLLFISTLNRNFKSWLLSIVVAEKLLGWIPAGTHNHGNYLKPSEVAKMARQHHLNLVDCVGMVWNPISQRFSLSSRDLDVNYLLCLQKSGA